MDSKSSVIPVERITGSIHTIRDQKVMLDKDLASLYGVQTKALVQAVKRNANRFPADFMFQLTSRELANLRSQIVTSSWGGTRHPPLAFTELGVAMMSSVLRSPRAIEVNIEIMRAFVTLRQFALTHEELRRRIDALESRFHSRFKKVLDELRKLTEPEPPPPPKPTSGFAREENRLGCWPCR